MIWSSPDLRALDVIHVGPLDVVYAFVSLAGEPTVMDASSLDEEERRRSGRFVRPADRRRFIQAHAALRVFLARCLGVEPASVRYEKEAHGKPRLVPDPAPLEFNLSHCNDLGLVAASRTRSVGVDVEHLREVSDAREIAETHFSIVERDALRALPQAEQRDAFFYCWTRKEAVIKAVGEGLHHDLDSFDVDITPSAISALRFAGRSGGEVRLSLRDLPSPPGYAAAGAVAAHASVPIRWQELSSS